MKNRCALLFLTVTLLACKTNVVTMSVVEPPVVPLSPEIKSVGIINRSKPSNEAKGIDKLDQVLSLEGAKLDKDGANEAFKGIYDELMATNRFDKVKSLVEVDIRGSGLGIFPSPIDWKTVEKICDNNDVDIIFVLEFFDTGTKVNYSNNPVKVQGPLGLEIPAIEHHASVQTMIKIGWRIYDPVDKYIIDEYPMYETITLTGRGINPVLALGAIMGRKEAVIQASNRMGQVYVSRILPFKIRVSRDYYVKGTNNFKIAKRRAQTGNWDGAAELWFNETTNTKRKIAGRAHYNMAIINEINGDLDKAIQWAQQAYEDFNDGIALKYVKILKNRRWRNEQFKMQHGN